eukprot:840702-Alexandrium_andersonii.AAC.2
MVPDVPQATRLPRRQPSAQLSERSAIASPTASWISCFCDPNRFQQRLFARWRKTQDEVATCSINKKRHPGHFRTQRTCRGRQRGLPKPLGHSCGPLGNVVPTRDKGGLMKRAAACLQARHP